MGQQWKQSKGLTIIYVGDGKGKTTAAVGMIVRALGHGWRVAFLQFMKEEKWPSGERDFLRSLSKKTSPLLLGEGEGEVQVRSQGEVLVEVVGQGFVGIMGDKKERDIHRAAAEAGYKKTLDLLTSKQYDLVVLDEILSAVDEGLLTEDQILVLIAYKPEDTTLVMTGHKHYSKIFEKADLVTEMKKLKHPFDSGYIAKKGVDF
ncbi:cob(I)yrinic acid a,c-diamide adenosyltransferase [Candidatus Uhrbacteria bacterium]|nr:cob(I)yrinic acid a,c-diamide adenosyltransferase [Candidatus Uhrbacteria bacterium]